MPTRVYSGAIWGLDGVQVEVEADITPGLPTVIIVGLPDTAVQEARERVKSAIKNTGYKFPQARVAVNLAPADLPKSGALYDLPIAVSILAESKLVNFTEIILSDSLFVGELALDGRVRPVFGILPIAISARDSKIKNLFVPKENAPEAALVKNLNVYGVENLAQVLAHLEARVKITPATRPATRPAAANGGLVDLSHIAGLTIAKHALTIAAAGRHNILFTGPPGSGKTMLARALQGILPPLSDDEFIDITKIYSIAGLLNGKLSVISQRPFRSPHHTSSRIALVGGGTIPKPGEVTLAHRGVLFLDEFPEFPRASLESLRQPLEDKIINVSRVAGSFQFPAEFILVAAQNPCPCGNTGNPHVACQCSYSQVKKYKSRISGPILDRIDLVAEVPYQTYDQLNTNFGEASKTVKERINRALSLQHLRYGPGKTNSQLTAPEVKKFCRLDSETETILQDVIDKMHLSARAYHRILKVARTIADISGSENILTAHIKEAIQYRPKQE